MGEYRRQLPRARRVWVMKSRVVEVRQESPRQDGVVQLLADLDAYLMSLYPGESNHLLDMEELCGPHMRFFVARAGQRIIGCAALRIDSEYGELKRMFVAPGNRGCGAGKSLLENIETQARQLGLRYVRLETGGQQAAALALYRNAGYRIRGPFGSYRLDPLSVFMEKSVAATWRRA